MCVCVAPIPATCCASFVGVSWGVCVRVLVTHSSNLLCKFCRRVKGCMYVCVVVTHSGNLLCEFVGVTG